MAGRLLLASVAMSEHTPDPGAEPRSPEAMRRAMADYVRAIHQAYLDASAPLPPAEQARLPLLAADDLTVLAVGTRNLHVLATTERLPSPAGPEVALPDAVGDVHWTLRFYDPVVAPGLGLVDESEAPDPGAVRDVLGVRTVVYHLTVPPGGGLTAHHAQHAGTGLAHSHAAAARDVDTIRSLVPSQATLVDELRGAQVAGLPRAQLLIARALAPTSTELADLSLDDADPDVVRRTLLAALRSAR